MTLPLYPEQNRPDRALISIKGDGAIGWLNTLLTCDVSSLAAGSAAYGALLSPQGKIYCDMFVFHGSETIYLDCAAELRAGLLQKLALYRLRAKLVIELDNDLEVGVHMTDPGHGLRYQDPRHVQMGWRSIGAAGALINTPGHHGYDTRRIMLGLGDSILDIGSDKHFPHEANFDQFGGVDFKKGCYVGQEVVSRMQHRGTARNRMLPVTLDGDVSTTEVVSGGKVVGALLSQFGKHGLALLRLDRIAESTAPLLVGSTRVHVTVPDWIAYEVALPEALL